MPGDQLPGDQLLGVIRKGTRTYQQLPSSPDSVVWLRLCQEGAWRAGGPRDPAAALWWTLRRPFRSLTYHASRAMLNRANALMGANWTLHDLRHTAAYRMARDPKLALTDVQWVLGHAHLTTTQIYFPAGRDEMVEAVREHHVQQKRMCVLRYARDTPGVREY
ncbi:MULTISPECIES: site-specific integrase [unclassified Streptomyces]|uniref:site-specific integrase n=1 Tax=unclassified Streptomyces TaxID=2593676 RepID=UPI003323B778